MKKLFIILLIIPVLSVYSQKQTNVLSFNTLEAINYPVLGVDGLVDFMGNLGFTIEETDREDAYEKLMSDIVFRSEKYGTTIITYFNTQCYTTYACNVTDVYCNKLMYDYVLNEVSSLSDYTKLNSRIDDEGIVKVFIKGRPESYPNDIVEFTIYKKNGIIKYLITLKNNPDYIPDMSKHFFRRRFEKYE